MDNFGVKIDKVPNDQATIPTDYIWPRGPEQSVFEGAEETSSDPPHGYVNILISRDVKITKPGFITYSPLEFSSLNFPDGSVCKIHIGEDICSLPFPLTKFMEQSYNGLVPGGELLIMAPYYTSSAYHSNSDNHIAITDNTFGPYCKRWCDAHKTNLAIPHVNFEPEACAYFYTEDWLLLSDKAKDWARLHYWNVVERTRVVLRAVK